MAEGRRGGALDSVLPLLLWPGDLVRQSTANVRRQIEHPNDQIGGRLPDLILLGHVHVLPNRLALCDHLFLAEKLADRQYESHRAEQRVPVAVRKQHSLGSLDRQRSNGSRCAEF